MSPIFKKKTFLGKMVWYTNFETAYEFLKCHRNKILRKYEGNDRSYILNSYAMTISRIEFQDL